jgi:hypothetical protein
MSLDHEGRASPTHLDDIDVENPNVLFWPLLVRPHVFDLVYYIEAL